MMKNGSLSISEFQLEAIEQCMAAGMADSTQMRQEYPDKVIPVGFLCLKVPGNTKISWLVEVFFGEPLLSGWAKNVSAL
jgi:hypothetical protein